MEIFAAFTSAVGNAKKLLDASRALQNAELKKMIADLSMQLADMSIEMVALKKKLASLEEENSSLKNPSFAEKPTMKWGCYQFNGDPVLYCPACFDVRHAKCGRHG